MQRTNCQFQLRQTRVKKMVSPASADWQQNRAHWTANLSEAQGQRHPHPHCCDLSRLRGVPPGVIERERSRPWNHGAGRW